MKSVTLFGENFYMDECEIIWCSENGDVDVSELISAIGGGTLEKFMEAEALAECGPDEDYLYESSVGK